MSTACEKVPVDPGTTVVAQGEENAEHFYIVNDGNFQVEVQKNDGDEPIKVADPAVYQRELDKSKNPFLQWASALTNPLATN